MPSQVSPNCHEHAGSDVFDAGPNTCAGPIARERKLSPAHVKFPTALIAHCATTPSICHHRRQRCSRFLMRAPSLSRSSTGPPKTFLKSRYVGPPPRDGTAELTLSRAPGSQSNDTRYVPRVQLHEMANADRDGQASAAACTPPTKS